MGLFRKGESAGQGHQGPPDQCVLQVLEMKCGGTLRLGKSVSQDSQHGIQCGIQYLAFGQG